MTVYHVSEDRTIERFEPQMSSITGEPVTTNGGLNMRDPVSELEATLEEIITLLRNHGEEHWQAWLSRDLQQRVLSCAP